MTDDEAQAFYDKLEEYYGDKLVNFEHYPKAFEFQVKMYKYYTQPQETTSEN